MKIWIDLTNSPHVNFFAQMIKTLQEDHEVVLTCRPLANTVELLEICGFTYTVVGKHYGRSKVRKTLGFPIRIYQLFSHLKKNKIDVAVSHSSFYSPVVARALGCRCIYLNDNEHAAGNRISFLGANLIMVPEFLSKEKVVRQGACREKILQYPGVKEGVYLWPQSQDIRLGRQAEKGHPVNIFVRPEPWSAQYYKGARNFIDTLLVDMAKKYCLSLLPRGDEQFKHYRQAKFARVNVLEKSMPLIDIMRSCDLFIGAGGTMTREAAVLGIPTISIYQDELLDVDRFLIAAGVMVHEPHLTTERVEDILALARKRGPDRALMEKGRQAYELIKDTILDTTLKRRNPKAT